MAEVESSLVTYLKTVGGVTAIFGASPNTRLYVDRIDPRITVAYPFLIIRTVAESPGYAHDGELKDTSLIQLDVYSDSKTTVNSGTTALRAALSGLTGAMGAVTVGSSFVKDTRGEFDPGTRVFRRYTDVEIGQNG